MHPMEALERRRDTVERLAYFLWQNAGCPPGTADRDWFLAEHVIETGSLTPASSPDSISQGGPSHPNGAA